MRPKGYDLDSANKPIISDSKDGNISSIWSLTVMTEDALAAPGKFGTDQLFSAQQMRMMMPLSGS